MDQIKVKQTVCRMTEARAALVRDNSFFGHLSMGLKLACAPCGSACTDGSRLIFDPEFAQKLSDREMQFVTLHEVLHCALEHCLRGKSLYSELYNIACDTVVNSMILDMWGLENFCVAGEEVFHLAPDGTEGRFYNAEEVYHMLLGQRSSTGSQSKNRKGAPGVQTGSKQSRSTAGRNMTGGGGQRSHTCGSMPLSPFDRHDLWQGISDKARLRENWNQKVLDAVKSCGDSAGMPQSIRRVVKELEKKARLNWKQLLHDFLQFDQYDYSFLPPDRRFAGQDFILPAFNPDLDAGYAENIWVCVDTSGSISGKELTCAMAEILDAMRQAGLKGSISFFDSNITEPVPFENESDFEKIVPSGGGGTSFHIIFEYLKEHMQEKLPRAILIFTDGYARWPREEAALGLPVLWLISERGRDNAPWGKTAKL